MGYETKVYFVETSKSPMVDTFVKDGNRWYSVWSEEDSEGKLYYHYGVDGNTKTYVDPESSEQCTRKWCSVVAMVELCKVGGWSS